MATELSNQSVSLQTQQSQKRIGRPPKYASPELMAKGIDKYFKSLELSDKPEPPTVSGLVLFLGFTDRQSMYDYKAKEPYTCIIKNAVERIIRYHEARIATSPTCAGSIFWLKNHAGYSDKQEHTLSGPDGGSIKIDSRFTIELVKPTPPAIGSQSKDRNE
jgi:hypothetical protein